MNGITLNAAAYYSGSPFQTSRDGLVTCAAYLLSTVIGKEIPMSSKQNRSLQANAADAEALESLRHMTSFARQVVTPPEVAQRKKYGALIEGFALGATAFHPGPWQLPIDAGTELDLAREVQPAGPGLATRIVSAVGAAAARMLLTFRRHREITLATRLLQEMDDRSLQDIGLSRHDVGRAVRYGRDWARWR
jgi:uncharacterized protein YjiS (DUF1127 family)